jgi:hypothetical protein
MVLCFFWVALSVCHLVSGATGACGFSNEPDGFYDLTWGTPVEEIRGLTFLRNSLGREGFQVYARRVEGLTVEGLVPESVEYEFWEGRFALATVTIVPLSAFVRVRDALFQRYGRGYEPSERIERYYWNGAKSHIALISRFDIS